MTFKGLFFIFNSSGHFVQRSRINGAILKEGIMKNISLIFSLFGSLVQDWFRRCS